MHGTPTEFAASNGLPGAGCARTGAGFSALVRVHLASAPRTGSGIQAGCGFIIGRWNGRNTGYPVARYMHDAGAGSGVCPFTFALFTGAV